MNRGVIEELRSYLKTQCLSSAILSVRRGSQETEERVHVGGTVWFTCTETRSRDTTRWVFEFGTHRDSRAVALCRFIATIPENTKSDARDTPILTRRLIVGRSQSAAALEIELAGASNARLSEGDSALLRAFNGPDLETGQALHIPFFSSDSAPQPDLSSWLHYLRARSDQLTARKKRSSSQ